MVSSRGGLKLSGWVEGIGRWPGWVIFVAAMLVSVAGFGWTLGGYFVGDDFGYVGRFHDFPLAQWPRLFVGSWAGDMWGFQLRELRPVTALSFMIDARVWGGNAWGFRVTNLMFHIGCASLVGWLAWRAAERGLACGVAAAVLFALHPAHAEPVQWITGRVDVLTTLLYLAGVVAFVRYRETGSGWWLAGFGGAYVGAAFAKEFGLTMPVMCMLADALWLRGGQSWRGWQRWAPYAVAVAIVTGYFFCRRAAFGSDGAGAAPPDWGSAEFHLQFAQRQLAYVAHLFPGTERWLHEGAGWWKSAAAVRVLGWLAVSVIAGFALWRWGARWEAVERRRAALFFGLGWYVVATLPLVVTYVSPRHLYLASAGGCIAAAMLLQAVLRVRAAVVVAAVVLAAWWVPKLKTTMRPWHEAAIISGRIIAELRRMEAADLKPDGALLLDVPEIREGAYVWTWAVPFVLRPPFMAQRWDDRLVVLESRGQYVDWERWHEQPAIAKLKEVTVPSWIVHTTEEKPVQQIPVRLERIRPAAEAFAADRLKEDPHGSWRRLVDAVK